jgi:DNA (cytosine-5)-methyltransferase 1
VKRKILVADLLCGAGGSSTGCERALRDLGLEMDLVCVNHWQTAIDTHTLNHPEARHFVQDIATVRPHLLVPEGYLDLLMASPTCTHHSVARGGKPTSDQQRSDPWHIITWLTELRVKRIIIENVWEFTKWGPVNAQTGKPVKSREGEYFRAWIAALRALGFTKLEWRKLNAADYGDATTRQRFILMGRSDGKPLRWPTPTHARKPNEELALLPGLKPWKPAREIIDWGIKGRSIFNRPKPLAAKTLARIYAGAVKYGWPRPYLVILRNHMAAQGLDMPLPALTAGGTHIGLAEPVIVNGRKNNQAQPVSSAPIPTLDTKGGVWLVEPDAPSLVQIAAGGKVVGESLILSQHNSGAPRSADDPLPTITTGGAGTDTRPGCARPMLVEPFVLSQASGGAPRATTEPLPTIVTGGQRGSGTALISPYYGGGSGETCTSTDDPLPTATAKARFGMVVPVTHSQGGNAARDLAEPIPTLTTAKGGEFAVVMPVTHADSSDRVRDTSEPLPTVTGANRGELAFITAQFGEREGQAPRTHDIDAPAPTGVTLGKGGLIEGAEGYDILFRMLEPHELAAAMGFNDADQAYEFAGTKTDKIKQIGNAVSVSKMKACVAAIMADAAPIPREAPPADDVVAA